MAQAQEEPSEAVNATRHLITAVSVAVLLVAAVAVPVAAAHNAGFGSQHTLSASANAGGDVFSGRVSSDLAACRSARSITLYLRVADGSVPERAVGTASTDAVGAWSKTLARAQAGDDYYAVASGNASRHPGAPEITQNGIDDNCDGIVDATAPPHSCWVPSGEPITATVTWSQTETTEPCAWTLDTYSGYWLGSVFMVSAAWWVEYIPTFDGSAVAFRYWEMDWTLVAIGPIP